MTRKRKRFQPMAWFLIAVVFCFAFVCSCVSPRAQAAAEAQDGEPLTVGVPTDRCPIFYRDPETGEPVGIGVDLMRFAAEEAGLIFDLDAYVWDRVCQDLRRWNEQGHHRSVSVNVSRNDIRDDRDIPGHFRRLIETYGLTPDQLRIEITETAYVENAEMLISTTEKLREYGFQVEMDDFGSGYSSLHMLKEVPVDRIKLDLHFLTASGDSEKCRTIVSCMINMVHSLGMEMIAEGVETMEQARFLRSQGCSEMQGFYFYKPMKVQEFERVIDGI